MEFEIAISGGGEATKAEAGKLAPPPQEPAALVALTKGGPPACEDVVETQARPAEPTRRRAARGGCGMGYLK